MSSEMKSLKILKLCGCSKIRKIPEFKGIMKSLSELHLDKTAIKKLPSSIECLTALTLLSIRDCPNLTCLPRNKDSLRSLKKLVVIGCSKLTYLPEHLRNIECLEHDLSRTAFGQPLDRKVSVRSRSLSPTLSRFPPLTPNHIWRVSFEGCQWSIPSFNNLEISSLLLSGNNFVSLPESLSQFSTIEHLYLDGCKILQSLSNIPSIITSLERVPEPPNDFYRSYNNFTVQCFNRFKLAYNIQNFSNMFQSSWSQPWSLWPQYNEISVGMTLTILNHYLQGLLRPKTGYETSTRRKEDRFGIAFQIIIPGCEIPWWITHQRSGNSISIELPPNWCNSRWMGFALCASLDASYSHISVEEFVHGETFGLKARVIALGDMPHCYYTTEISCSTKLVARHIWLLHLSRDDWFATARSGEFNQLEVVFESSRPGLFVRKCGLRLVYKQDVKMFTQTICSSNRITFEGCGGSHDEFDNLWRNCDDYNDKEPSAICSSSEAMESCISSDNGIQILYPSNISVSHQKNCYCPAGAPLKTIFTTQENFGRRFWSCGKIKQNVSCGFFEWEDPEMCSHERRVICELQERLEKIDKDKVDQDELVMLREENKNLRIALLFFGIALLFSWVAIVIYLYYNFISSS